MFSTQSRSASRVFDVSAPTRRGAAATFTSLVRLQPFSHSPTAVQLYSLTSDFRRPMTADTDLSLLRRDVQYLLDRTSILDCVARHARGCDRHDVDLISAAYHDDGMDEHGFAVNAGPDYGEWANKTH